MKTPHINLIDEKLGFGKTVLMPGDPLRAKFIAENFLENPVLVNNVRGVNGYTGFYKGVKVSVMASGMGMPSIGIYSYELYKHFGVQNIMRIGSAGAINENDLRKTGATSPVSTADLIHFAFSNIRNLLKLKW